MSDANETVAQLVARRNAAKYLFTAGPASLLPENLTGLRPCFGRGDRDYLEIEAGVLDALKALTRHAHVARLQGSASLALEVASLNFLSGRVLVISTGYYSDRLIALAESAKRRTGCIASVTVVEWPKMRTVDGGHDWVVACYTETSNGLRLPIDDLADLARRSGARLMLDATASIGLEDGHSNADVIAYSSCKGLFGLSGAAFIAFNELPRQAPDSFYLNLDNHLERRMTGPYHAIASLADVLPRHADFKAAVVRNKGVFTDAFRKSLTRPNDLQPLLCTQVSCRITSNDPRAVLYASRGNDSGSVVCHLGEAHLGRDAKGDILKVLDANPV
jgi:aspartate aminotransferase-like enzyme